MIHTLDNIDLRQPIIPAYGAGVDSTAMIIEMVKRKVPIQAILFANTGSEKPETIAYLPIFSAWLIANGYPPVTIVAYKGNHGRYSSLHGACISNKVMPSLARSEEHTSELQSLMRISYAVFCLKKKKKSKNK